MLSHKPKNMAILTTFPPAEAMTRNQLRGRVTLVKEKDGEQRQKTVNELGFLSWAGRRSNTLWIVVKIFDAEIEEKQHTIGRMTGIS